MKMDKFVFYVVRKNNGEVLSVSRSLHDMKKEEILEEVQYDIFGCTEMFDLLAKVETWEQINSVMEA